MSNIARINGHSTGVDPQININEPQFNGRNPEAILTERRSLKVGDHVSWNSEAGRVRGHITRIITSEIQFKGYTVRASKDEPQYEIKSDTTDHVAMHKGSALRKLTSQS